MLGIYSWVMIGTSGEAASWAWPALAAGLTLIVVAAGGAALARRAGDGR